MKQRLHEAYDHGIIVLGGAAFSAALYRLPLAALDLQFFILAAVVLCFTSRFIVSIPRVKGEINVSDTFIFLTLLLYGSEAAIVLAAAEAFCASRRFCTRRRTVCFNMAMLACATYVTTWVLHACYGPVGTWAHAANSARYVTAIALMGLMQYVGNAGLASVRSALRTRQSIWHTWKNGFLWTSVTYFAGASAAALIAPLAGRVGPYAFLAMTPIIAIIYFTYRTYLKNVESSQQQAEQAQRYVAELSQHITEQERIGRALKQSEEQFRNAFDHAAGMALVATDGRWLQVNQSLCRMLGYSEQELLALKFQEITHPDDLGRELVHNYQLLDGQTTAAQLEKRFLHQSGQHVWVLSSSSLIRDAQGQPAHFIFQIQDITERKRAEEQVHFAALHDGLTGLANRTLLSDRLSLAFEHAKCNRHYRFAVLFIDLDRFKLINDSLGHPTGDRLLCEIARRLEGCLRPGDTVARLGGDEFAILLDDLEGEFDPTMVAERVQQQLTHPFNLDGHEVFTSASIGVAFSEAGYERPEDILRDADTAMYRAKFNGKARHEVFDRAMHTHAVQMLQLENDLRRAVERHEVCLYYQPLLALASGAVVGFEALARWQHPERGLILPAEFIPLAEETGLIVPLGTQVLREACRQLADWHARFPAARPPYVSVNISAKQFQHTQLVQQIEDILRETGLAPGHLHLEVTESVLMQDAAAAARMLTHLKSLGVRLSLDDFGTGYSSLSYLHRFPFDTLKVDRSFVGRMGADTESAKIVKTIMTLADELSLEVVAEGVETPEQLAQLRTLGCHYAQGYAFAPPCAAAAAEAFITELPAQVAVKPEGVTSLGEYETLEAGYSM